MSNQVRHLERDLILKVVLNQVWDDVADNMSHLCQSSQQFICLEQKTLYNNGLRAEQ